MDFVRPSGLIEPASPLEKMGKALARKVRSLCFPLADPRSPHAYARLKFFPGIEPSPLRCETITRRASIQSSPGSSILAVRFVMAVIASLGRSGAEFKQCSTSLSVVYRRLVV